MEIDDGAGGSPPSGESPGQTPSQGPAGPGAPAWPPTSIPAEEPPRDPGRGRRRMLIAAGVVAAALVLIAAGFGLAQLVDRDGVETASSVAGVEDASAEDELADSGSESRSEPESDSQAPAETPEADTPETDTPPLAEQFPLLEQLPFDADELERFLDDLQQRFGDDFSVPFDEIPELDQMPGLEDLPELEGMPGLDALPFLDELPLDEEALGELFERLLEQFDGRLPPGLDGLGPDPGSFDGETET